MPAEQQSSSFSSNISAERSVASSNAASAAAGLPPRSAPRNAGAVASSGATPEESKEIEVRRARYNAQRERAGLSPRPAPTYTNRERYPGVRSSEELSQINAHRAQQGMEPLPDWDAIEEKRARADLPPLAPADLDHVSDEEESPSLPRIFWNGLVDATVQHVQLTMNGLRSLRERRQGVRQENASQAPQPSRVSPGARAVQQSQAVGSAPRQEQPNSAQAAAQPSRVSPGARAAQQSRAVGSAPRQEQPNSSQNEQRVRAGLPPRPAPAYTNRNRYPGVQSSAELSQINDRRVRQGMEPLLDWDAIEAERAEAGLRSLTPADLSHDTAQHAHTRVLRSPLGPSRSTELICDARTVVNADGTSVTVARCSVRPTSDPVNDSLRRNLAALAQADSASHSVAHHTSSPSIGSRGGIVESVIANGLRHQSSPAPTSISSSQLLNNMQSLASTGDTFNPALFASRNHDVSQVIRSGPPPTISCSSAEQAQRWATFSPGFFYGTLEGPRPPTQGNWASFQFGGSDRGGKGDCDPSTGRCSSSGGRDDCRDSSTSSTCPMTL